METFVHAVFDSDEFRTYLFKDLHHDYKEFNFKAYKKEHIDGFYKTL